MGPGIVVTMFVCALGALDAYGVVDIPEPAAVAGAKDRVALVQEHVADVQAHNVAYLNCRRAILNAATADDEMLVKYCP